MDQELYDRLWQIFQDLGATALTMNHYNLAEETEINDPAIWRKFLLEPEIADYIRQERKLIQESELNKMIHDISKSNSVGKAQLMNTLAKLSDGQTIKDGPIFVYTYVPLSPEQKQAENVNMLDKDIFLKGDF